jgi:outer membrane protein TolC
MAAAEWLSSCLAQGKFRIETGGGLLMRRVGKTVIRKRALWRWFFFLLLNVVCLNGHAENEVDEPDRPSTLYLHVLLEKVTNTYPPYLAALIERDIAQGQLRSARGAFDFQTFARIFDNPTGFYQSSTIEAGFEQFTGLWGSTLFGGYRWTDGILPDYYYDRRTDGGGSPNIGFKLPLLKNRAIDQRRRSIQNARLDVELADPVIQRQHLDFVRAASAAYLNWIKTGRALEVAERMLALAKDRRLAIETRIDQGLEAKAVALENDQVVVSREILLIDAQRDFDSAGIALSLFHRDDQDEPVRPLREQLPETWPSTSESPEDLISSAWKYASRHRPELRIYELELLKLGVDKEYYRNQLLPSLDAYASASQNLGESLYKDTGELELKLGIEFRVPLQRNAAKGAADANAAKIEQMQTKASFAMEKVFAEIEKGYVSISASDEKLTLTRENRRLAEMLREIEEDRFRLGATNLLSVQIREQTAIKAEQSLLSAQHSYYLAIIDFLISSGINFDTYQEDSPGLWELAGQWSGD